MELMIKTRNENDSSRGQGNETCPGDPVGPKDAEKDQEIENRDKPEPVEGSAEHIYDHVTSVAKGKERVLIVESRSAIEEAKAATLNAERVFKLVEASATDLTARGPLDKDTGEELTAVLRAVYNAVSAAKELIHVGEKLVDELAVLKLTKLRLVSAMTKADLTERFARKSARKAGEAQSAVAGFVKFVRRRANMYRGDIYEVESSDDEDASKESTSLKQAELDISEDDTLDSNENESSSNSQYPFPEIQGCDSDSKRGLQSYVSREEPFDTDEPSERRNISNGSSRSDTSEVLHTNTDLQLSGSESERLSSHKILFSEITIVIEDTDQTSSNGDSENVLRSDHYTPPYVKSVSEISGLSDEICAQFVNKVSSQYCEDTVPFEVNVSTESVQYNDNGESVSELRSIELERKGTDQLECNSNYSPEATNKTLLLTRYDSSEMSAIAEIADYRELVQEQGTMETNKFIETDDFELDTLCEGFSASNERIIEAHGYPDCIIECVEDSEFNKTNTCGKKGRGLIQRCTSDEVYVNVENDADMILEASLNLRRFSQEIESGTFQFVSTINKMKEPTEKMNQETNKKLTEQCLFQSRNLNQSIVPETIQITIVDTDNKSSTSNSETSDTSEELESKYCTKGMNLNNVLPDIQHDATLVWTERETQSTPLGSSIDSDTSRESSVVVENKKRKQTRYCQRCAALENGIYQSQQSDVDDLKGENCRSPEIFDELDCHCRPQVIRSISEYVENRAKGGDNGENPEGKGPLQRLKSTAGRRGSEELGVILENAELKVPSPELTRPASRTGTRKRRPLRRSISEVLRSAIIDSDEDRPIWTTDSYCLPEGASSAPTILADEPFSSGKIDYRKAVLTSQMSYSSAISIAGLSYDVFGLGMSEEEKLAAIGAETAAAAAAAAAASSVAEAAVAGMHAANKANTLIAIYTAAHDRIEEQSSLLAAKLKTKIKLMRISSRRSSCSSCSSDSSIIITGTVNKKRWMIGTISSILFVILLTYAFL